MLAVVLHKDWAFMKQ